ncbi:MAG: diadenosine tetraphosphatase [Gammaproteobacteria bacterium]|nr:MAG: diadenosine tetraphosphatase [Gammaproteobacteria bacterium]
MSTYFIGDVHGCYDELMQLLERLAFDRRHDRLIFVGDLINRGPKSLDVLRFVRDLGEAAEVVLGNHDISLLAYAWGVYHGRGSDYPEILRAADSEALLDWLRHRPLLLHDEASQAFVVHAGIPPRWSLKKAQKQARKAEKVLRGNKAEKFLRYAYGKREDTWQADYSKYDKFRYRLNGFARIRYCEVNGEPNFQDKCPLGQQPRHLLPWFSVRQHMQNDGDARIVFGHWAALGYCAQDQVICLDSGCVWGGKLTAVCLENHRVIRTQVPSRQ